MKWDVAAHDLLRSAQKERAGWRHTMKGVSPDWLTKLAMQALTRHLVNERRTERTDD